MPKYQGNFNWHGQTFELWTEAPREIQAFHNFCIQLSKLVGKTVRQVRLYFYNPKTMHHMIKEVNRNETI